MSKNVLRKLSQETPDEHTDKTKIAYLDQFQRKFNVK